jgi:hypothetical protein
MPSRSPPWSGLLALALLACESSPRTPVAPPVPAKPVPTRPVVKSPELPPPVAALPWVIFSSERWDFSAEFPGAPASEVLTVESMHGPVELHLFSSEQDGWAYMISAMEAPETGKAVVPAKVLDGARDGAVANVGGRLVKETQREHHGLPARRVEIVASPASGEQRLIGLLILRERRLYQVLVAAPSPAPALDAAAERFFAALQLPTK